MIPIKRKNINFVSFRLKRKKIETNLLSTTCLVLDKFSSLALDSTNFFFQTFHLFILRGKLTFLLDSSNLTIDSSFSRLANFNSSMNFLAIFKDLYNSLRRVSQASIKSTEALVSFLFKLSQT